MDTFTDFAEAEAAKTEGTMVCGTLMKDGEPRYFVLPSDVPDHLIRDTAFQIREGRPVSSWERWILELAEQEAAAQPT